ncbi:MAG: hypothetical protein NWF04_03245 [Candidatus Bathyarchaeota archaeon]|nr:hypothetical protein [Candidatus Bathyarchaeota archaeon]
MHRIRFFQNTKVFACQPAATAILAYAPKATLSTQKKKASPTPTRHIPADKDPFFTAKMTATQAQKMLPNPNITGPHENTPANSSK